MREVLYELNLPAREVQYTVSTGIAEKPTLRTLPRTVYFTDAPITDDHQYVQYDDERLKPGTMLLAAGNFNVEGDTASCAEGQYQEVNHELGRSVLEIRRGDLVRFTSKTTLPNICLGELIRSTSGRLQADELLPKTNVRLLRQ